MVLGHYGVAFAAKKWAPNVSLGTLFVAAQLADLLWPLFLLTRTERYAWSPGITVVSSYDFTFYPYSHSLLMDAVWGLLLGLAYYRVTRNRRGAWVVGLVVVSHWVLDLLVHIPDLPLAPFSPVKVGLGGWNFWSFTLAAEAIFFFGGLAIYLVNTRAKKVAGKWVLALLVALLVVLYASTLNNKQENASLTVMFVVFMLLQAVLVTLAAWADRNRKPVPGQ